MPSTSGKQISRKKKTFGSVEQRYSLQQFEQRRHFVPIGAPSHLFPPPLGLAPHPGIVSAPAPPPPPPPTDANHNVASVDQNHDAGAPLLDDELFKLRFAASQVSSENELTLI